MQAFRLNASGAPAEATARLTSENEDLGHQRLLAAGGILGTIAVFLRCTICYRAHVKFRTLLPRMLAVLAVLSLVSAPMVTPSAAAMKVANPTATTMAHMESMPDGMPCPSNQRQQPPDCHKSCPLATLCCAKCFPSASTTAAIMLIRLSAADVIAPGNNVGRDLLPNPPPPRPPRT